MKILFTGIGTSDPVRDYHDGPALHIMRHYKPDKVMIFLTAEISRQNDTDSRIGKMLAYIRDTWTDYSPEVRVIESNIEDPSDLDTVAEPITDAVMELTRKYPDSEILLNITSGTPQMKFVLYLLASDTRLRTLGIQVKNHENASGKSDRTNAENYSAEAALDLNEDELPDAPNRCVEPELLHIQRQRARAQVLAMLNERNYSAVYAMKNTIPDRLKALVGHLDARDRMDSETAKKRAQSVRLPFSLYPVKEVRANSDYSEVSELYLVLLNRCHRKQYEEMILRLNPLIVRLELRMISNALSPFGMSLKDVIDRPYSKRPRFYPNKLENALPEVYEGVKESFGGELRDSDVSIDLCWYILAQLPGVPQAQMDVLQAFRLVNEKRNELAHQFTTVSAEQIEAACSMKPEQLMNSVGSLIASCYPECDTTLFSIYKRCGDYIRDNLP